MVELTKLCTVNNIHIEEIPQFALKVMSVRFIPPSKAQYDYSLDDPKQKLEEFLPPFIYSSLLSF